jgi:hypothetical protein
VPSKPEGFVPSPYSYSAILALSFVTVLLTPFSASKYKFPKSVALPALRQFYACPLILRKSIGICWMSDISC